MDANPEKDSLTTSTASVSERYSGVWSTLSYLIRPVGAAKLPRSFAILLWTKSFSGMIDREDGTMTERVGRETGWRIGVNTANPDDGSHVSTSGTAPAISLVQ
jgi:hypothetical protein